MPKFNPNKHHRRSIRLKGYDYSQPGAYFLTLCTYKQTHLFGTVEDGEMTLNHYGLIAHNEWAKSADIRQEIKIDVFVVMPNHLHGIVFFTKQIEIHDQKKMTDARAHSRAPLQRKPKSLWAFISGFKSVVTKQINLHRHTPGVPVWQRNYYEHVIRNDRVLKVIREYISQNPLRWHLDRYNASATESDPQAKYLWDLLQSS